MFIKDRKWLNILNIVGSAYILLFLQEVRGMDEWGEEKIVCQNKFLIEMQSERKSNLKKAENAWRQEKGEIIPDELQSFSSDAENSYHFNKGLRERSYFD